MPTLTFTIANIYDPKPDKKTGSIKTDTGNWISYWPSDKHLFREGIKYSADCTKRDYQGKTYYTIKSPDKGGLVAVESSPASFGSQPTPQHDSSTSQGLSKDEIITRLAIAKSCIESDQSQADADSWLAWVKKESPVDFESSEQVDPNLDDEIPF